MSTTQAHQAAINTQDSIREVSDALWARGVPRGRCTKVKKRQGRPRVPNRSIQGGLLVLSRSGGQWKTSPRQYAAKSTAFDRFSEWVQCGVLGQAWTLLLTEYDDLIGIEWAWQRGDGCSVKAPRLGESGTFRTLLANSKSSVFVDFRRFSDGSGEAPRASQEARPSGSMQKELSGRGRALPDPPRADCASS